MTGPICSGSCPCANAASVGTPHAAVSTKSQSEQLVMLRRMLSLQLATLEAQNKEVAGDDDAEEDDEGMGALDVAAPALQVE